MGDRPLVEELMKYVIYLRISTKKQDERPQREECLNFLRTFHKGQFEYAVYTDKISSKKPIFQQSEEIAAKSKRKRKLRPGIQEVLAALQPGDVLVSVRIDRISRSQYELHRLANLLKSKKVNLLLVGNPNLEDPILLGMYAAMAEKEVDLLSKRIKEKLRSKRLRGEKCGKDIPYGYQLHPTKKVAIKRKDGDGFDMKLGHLVVSDAEQKVLAQMLELSAEGRSYRQVAARLADLGCTNRAGRPFGHMSIYRMLHRIRQTKSTDQLQEATAGY